MRLRPLRLHGPSGSAGSGYHGTDPYIPLITSVPFGCNLAADRSPWRRGWERQVRHHHIVLDVFPLLVAVASLITSATLGLVAVRLAWVSQRPKVKATVSLDALWWETEQIPAGRSVAVLRVVVETRRPAPVQVRQVVLESPALDQGEGDEAAGALVDGDVPVLRGPHVFPHQLFGFSTAVWEVPVGALPLPLGDLGRVRVRIDLGGSLPHVFSPWISATRTPWGRDAALAPSERPLGDEFLGGPLAD